MVTPETCQLRVDWDPAVCCPTFWRPVPLGPEPMDPVHQAKTSRLHSWATTSWRQTWWEKMSPGASLTHWPGRSGFDSKNGIFYLVLLIGIFRSSHYNALRWMPQDLTDDKSTLVQVMAWCRQASSHYLSQCWLSSLSPYGVARPQWVNTKAETKWLPFCRQHFQSHFLVWKLPYLDSDLTSICLEESNQQ